MLASEVMPACWVDGTWPCGGAAGWVRPVLDLYLPAEAGEPPLAVVVPDAVRTRGGSDYGGLARDLAHSGVAVGVVHWGVESPES